MYWFVLCTSANFNPDKLAANLAANTAAVSQAGGYSHAVVAFSPKPDLSGKISVLAEFSGQEIKYYQNVSLAQSIAGYYDWNDYKAVIVAKGEVNIAPSLLNSSIMTASDAWFADAKAAKATKAGFPWDCLGYCVGMLKVLGVTVALPVKAAAGAAASSS